MEKKLSKFEIANLKRTAENVSKLISRKNKLAELIKNYTEEYNEIVKNIDLYDAATIHITGGYHTEDIIERKVVFTDKLDKNGKPIKKTVFEFKYPDTIIPPTKEEDNTNEDNTNYTESEYSKEEEEEIAAINAENSFTDNNITE